MRHLEIRDLWLQKEVVDGKVIVVKTPGVENPADLMTKVLSLSETEGHLARMNIYFRKNESGNNSGKAEISMVGIVDVDMEDREPPREK